MKTIARRYGVGVLRCAVFTLAVIGCWTATALAVAGKNGPKIGDAPPPLVLGEIVQGPAGEPISWANLRGKVVVLDFWNISCGPCVQGIPHWNALVDQFTSRPVVFIAISDDHPGRLRTFLTRTPMKGWLALDQAFRPTFNAFDVWGIPHTVVVDATGKIAAIVRPTDLHAEELEAILAGQPHSLPAPKIYTPNAVPDPEVQTRVTPVDVAVAIDGPFPLPQGAYNFLQWQKPDYQFSAQKARLGDALTEFFGLSSTLVFGSEFLPEGLYDITAVGPPDQLPALQARLRETVRTKLGIDVQVETREVDVYVLTVANPAPPFLKVSTGAVLGGGSGIGKFRLQGAQLYKIARMLEWLVGGPVIDETNLAGIWDADLQWELSPAEENGGPPDPASVIKAVRERLGLELKPTRRERSVLIVSPVARAGE